MNHRFSRDEIVLALITISWGFNYAAIKLALREVLPLAFLAVRNGLSILVLLSIFLVTRSTFRMRAQDRGRFLLIGAVGVGVNQVAFNIGINYTSAANASLLFTTSPIFGLVLAILLEKAHVSPRRWLGVAAALCGAALVIAGGRAQLSFSIDSFGGDLLMLVAAATWAFYSVVGRPLIKVYSPLHLTLYATLIGIPLSLPIVAGDILAQPWAAVSPLAWTLGAFSGAVMSISGLLWYRILDRIGTSHAMLSMYLVPLFAVLSAVIFLQESLALAQLAGAAAVLLGVNIARQG